MRKRICYEDALVFGDQFLIEGSVNWDEDAQLPLVWDFGVDTKSLLGHATDLRREEDGAITAELTFQDPKNEALAEAEDLSATFFADEVGQETHDGVQVFYRLRLRKIAIVPARSALW